MNTVNNSKDKLWGIFETCLERFNTINSEMFVWNEWVESESVKFLFILGEMTLIFLFVRGALHTRGNGGNVKCSCGSR